MSDAIDALIKAADELYSRRSQPRHVLMSPWRYDVARLVIEEGKTPYLAMKRADLNQRRAREAALALDPRSIWSIARGVQP